MYAVIFRAEIDQLDNTYTSTANSLRQLAISEYGCLEFTSVTDDKYEVAISYWNSLEDIKAWKNDSTHQQAQQLGKSTWYSQYSVDITKIVDQHSFSKVC